MNPKETGYLRILVERGFIGFQQAAELESARQSDEAGDPSKAVWDLAVELGHVTQRQSAEALTVLDSGSSAGTSAGRQGRELGGYELISRLGQGAMGAVYKARQKSLNRLVALKVLPKQLAKDGEFINRFMREARAAGMVSHPNIVAGIDAGCADGYHYLAMEYVDGIDLGARLDRDGRLEESEAVAICIQIAEALEHAHRNGLVHRDVKPENVLVTEDGTAKLCDLGLARVQAESMRLTQSGLAVGTANYMSPEQVRGGEADGRSDVYSLGCVLYHLVTGQTPHQGDSALTVMQKHVGEEAAKVTAVRPELSKALEAVISRMMAREPSARYETAGDAAADLRRVVSGEVPEALRESMAARRAQSSARESRVTARAMPAGGSGARITAVTRRHRPAGRRSNWLLISVVGAGLLGFGVVGFLWGRSGASAPPQLPPPEKLPPQIDNSVTPAPTPTPGGTWTVYTQWPFDAAEAKRRQEETAKALGLPVEQAVDIGGGVKLELVLVPAGEFMMGEALSYDDLYRKGGISRDTLEAEQPPHRVRLTRPYYLGKYEVTQEQWKRMMGGHLRDPVWRGDREPTVCANWEDSQEFVKKLNARNPHRAAEEDGPPRPGPLPPRGEGVDRDWVFRLPTEAEWEYACRAGAETPFWFGDKIAADVANYDGSIPWDGQTGVRRDKTVPVGSFQPNPWGLYDVAGNVWEWCQDWYGPYGQKAQVDPKGPESGEFRVARGGSWRRPPNACRSASRYKPTPGSRYFDQGFRVLMEVPAPGRG